MVTVGLCGTGVRQVPEEVNAVGQNTQAAEAEAVFDRLRGVQRHNGCAAPYSGRAPAGAEQ